MDMYVQLGNGRRLEEFEKVYISLNGVLWKILLETQKRIL